MRLNRTAVNPAGCPPTPPPPHPTHSAVTNCTAIEGAEYSACGPPCPRSCDDLVVSLGS